MFNICICILQCLTLLNACDGLDVVTIEGIGNKKIGYHPIQKRLANLNGSQCGYCSPAMVMNMYGLMESNRGNLTMLDIENSFAGNMCRCTGYRPILDAMKSFATDTNIDYMKYCSNDDDIEDLKICQKTGQQCLAKCVIKSEFNYIKYENGNEWYTPKSINEIFEIFKKFTNEKYILIAGNTAHGVYRRPDDLSVFIDLNKIAELHTSEINESEIKLGANVNLTEAMAIFQKASQKSGFEYCSKLYHHFDLIANIPVRNVSFTQICGCIIKNELSFILNNSLYRL